MKKEKMVTRTVTKTTAKVLSIDVLTQNVEVKEYTIGGKYKKDELLSKIQVTFDSDNLKHVSVKEFTEEDVLLGMPESEFIKNAVVLPPRTKQNEVEENE